MADTLSPAPRREYIDSMKGLGILLVVFGHFMEPYRLGFLPIGATFLCIYWFHMALFCMCSGLVARFSPRKWLLQQVWLYAVGQVLMLVFRALVLREDFAATGGLWQALVLPWRHMWYLYALLFWQLTAPLLAWVRDHAKWPGAIALFAATVALGLWAGKIEWPLGLVRVLGFYPFYAFGVLFRPQIDAWARAAERHLMVRLLPGLTALVLYGLYFYRCMQSEVPLGESARIFHDVPYFDGYAMQDRARFYLVGILTSLALIAALGQCRTLRPLGRRTLPVYLLHMPILAFYTTLGFYEPGRTLPLPAVVVWFSLLSLGVIGFCSSGPMVWLFDQISSVWLRLTVWSPQRPIKTDPSRH